MGAFLPSQIMVVSILTIKMTQHLSWVSNIPSMMWQSLIRQILLGKNLLIVNISQRGIKISMLMMKCLKKMITLNYRTNQASLSQVNPNWLNRLIQMETLSMEIPLRRRFNQLIKWSRKARKKREKNTIHNMTLQSKNLKLTILIISKASQSRFPLQKKLMNL